MNTAPVVDSDNPLEFYSSDRGRFERTYVAFLYVLVEAWRARALEQARVFMGNLVSLVPIETALANAEQAHGEEQSGIQSMREVRDYMCHRDLREYWDKGREAVNMQMHTHESIYDAFSHAFLKARKELRARDRK
jgi:hypothetical protein